jgi:hypothetical protein
MKGRGDQGDGFATAITLDVERVDDRSQPPIEMDQFSPWLGIRRLTLDR